MAEFHPVIYMYNWENPKLEYSYFNIGVPYEETTKGKYAETESAIESKEYFRTHTFSEVINEGLDLNLIKEYDYSRYNCFENMPERVPGRYVYGITQENFPHVFALVAQIK